MKISDTYFEVYYPVISNFLALKVQSFSFHLFLFQVLLRPVSYATVHSDLSETCVENGDENNAKHAQLYRRRLLLKRIVCKRNFC